VAYGARCALATHGQADRDHGRGQRPKVWASRGACRVASCESRARAACGESSRIRSGWVARWANVGRARISVAPSTSGESPERGGAGGVWGGGGEGQERVLL